VKKLREDEWVVGGDQRTRIIKECKGPALGLKCAELQHCERGLWSKKKIGSGERKGEEVTGREGSG